MNTAPTTRSKLDAGLAWIVLILLLLACMLIIRPFLSALLWAVVLTFATWPLFTRLNGWLGGRRTIAALIMSMAMIAVVVLPFVILGASLADNVKGVSTAVRQWLEAGPPAPAWLAKIPLVGTDATDAWNVFAEDSQSLVEAVKPLLETASGWMITITVAIGAGVIELGLSILISFFLYRSGSDLALRVQNGVNRVAGERGLYLLGVAGNTVISVVYGVLGTALVQAVMAGVGFLIAGVPGAVLLSLLTFILSVVPIGPPVVWIPVALWLFQQGRPGWGIFMLIWGVGVSSIDNVVKPWLISHGSPMPFLLIFFGVVGGAMVFGLIGVFVGPTLLAIGYRLVNEWTLERGRARDTELEPPAPTPAPAAPSVT